MTALDRAFIKAYDSGRTPPTDVAVEQPTAPRTARSRGKPHTKEAASRHLSWPPSGGEEAADQQDEARLVTLRIDVPSHLLELEKNKDAAAHLGDGPRSPHFSAARFRVESPTTDEAIWRDRKPAESTAAPTASPQESVTPTATEPTWNGQIASAANSQTSTKAEPSGARTSDSAEDDFAPGAPPVDTQSQIASPTATVQSSADVASAPDSVAKPANSEVAGKFRIDAPHQAAARGPNASSFVSVKPPAEAAEPASDGGAAKSADSLGNDEQAATWSRPAFEVDHFSWPKTCEAICLQARQELTRTADQIWSDASSGKNVLAVAGLRPCEGRSTLTLCVAKYLADMDLRVVLVDANFYDPAVARMLGIAVQIGWDEVLVSDLPLGEALIESIDEGLTVLPLQFARADEDREECGDQLRQVIRSLRDQYDVVLIDVAACEPRSKPWMLDDRCGIDCAILLRDESPDSHARILQLASTMRRCNIEPIGIIENAFTAGPGT